LRHGTGLATKTILFEASDNFAASLHVRYNVYVKEEFVYTHFVTSARHALQDNYYKHELVIKGDSNRWREHFNPNKLTLCRWTKDIHLKEMEVFQMPLKETTMK